LGQHKKAGRDFPQKNPRGWGIMTNGQTFAFCLGITVSLWQLVAVFTPSLRPHWKGSRIRCGAVTCLGGAMASGGVPLSLAVGGKVNSNSAILTGLVIVVGLLVAGIGCCLDSIEPKQ